MVDILAGYTPEQKAQMRKDWDDLEKRVAREKHRKNPERYDENGNKID